MSRPNTWDQDLSAPVMPRSTHLWLKIVLGIFIALILILGFSGLRGSIESPRLANRIFQELSTEPRARSLYRNNSSLQLGFGSEEAFLRHILTWKPQFGEIQPMQGSDAKRFLPFATKLEIQGSRGAWFGVMARLEPFERLHGIAFGLTREQARRNCFNLYAKTHLCQWLERGLSYAHKREKDDSANLDPATLEQIRALPIHSKELDPTTFTFHFTSTGAELDLGLAPDKTLSIHWSGESPGATIDSFQISGARSSR